MADHVTVQCRGQKHFRVTLAEAAEMLKQGTADKISERIIKMRVETTPTMRGASCNVSGATRGRDLETGGPTLSRVEKLAEGGTEEARIELAWLRRIHYGVRASVTA